MRNWGAEQWRVFLTGMSALAALVGIPLAIINVWKHIRPAERLDGQAFFVPYRLNAAESLAAGASSFKSVNQSRIATAYWQVSVTNSGRKTVNNVRLTVESVRAYEIEGQEPTADRGESILVASQMVPKQEIRLHVWTVDFPPRMGSLKAHLVHDDGHGCLRVHQTVGWPFTTIYFYRWVFAIGAALIGIIYFVRWVTYLIYSPSFAGS